jgi:hypothetical protein
MNGTKINTYNLSVGKPERTIPLGRFRRRWVDLKKMDLGESFEGIDYIILVQDRAK